MNAERALTTLNNCQAELAMFLAIPYACVGRARLQASQALRIILGHHHDHSEIRPRLAKLGKLS